MKKCSNIAIKNMHIRLLKKNDDLNQIFELCKQNMMIGENYATTYDIWDFQYNKNPLNKSWNSVVEHEEQILGHIGLYPLPLRGPQKFFLAGSISNGVLSESIRNKLLPFKDKKTFSIIPLIDNCASSAFGDGIDIVFVHSTIHPMIWKALKYKNIDVTCKTTYHTGLKGLYQKYHNLLCKKRVIFNGVLGIIFSAILTLTRVLPMTVTRCSHFLTKNSNRDISICKFDVFDNNFKCFFDQFNDANKTLVTYDRNIEYLNWKFSQTQFKKFKININNTLVGYLVLQKNNETNDFDVIDYIILNKHLNETQFIFNQLSLTEGMSISFTHFLSCEYSESIYNELNKQGITLSLNPAHMFSKKQKITKAPIYFKINNMTNSPIMLDERSWFISPIFFTPSYFLRP